jgi:hypothetical protein
VPPTCKCTVLASCLNMWKALLAMLLLFMRCDRPLTSALCRLACTAAIACSCGSEMGGPRRGACCWGGGRGCWGWRGCTRGRWLMASSICCWSET